jgi:hypothetical protein
VLQIIFDLTQAEASLAVNISRGETPAAIARSNGVTIATIRSLPPRDFGPEPFRRGAHTRPHL